MTAAVRRLVGELGLEGEVLVAPPGLDLLVYRAGRLRRVPLSASDLIRSDIVSAGAKLRMLLEPFTSGPDPEERVARYFARKLGREIYETVAGPLYGGLYASDPADMVMGISLAGALRDLGVGRSLLLALLRRGGRLHPPPACSFRNGMRAIPDALAQVLSKRLRLGVTAHGLRPAGGGWALELDGDRVEADHVVLTVPAAAAAGLLREVAPSAAAAAGSLRYNPIAVVHLEAETTLEGLGFQVALTEGMVTRGVTFNDSLFGRRDVYTSYLGGAKRPEVAGMHTEDLARLAVDEFRTLTGFDARVLSVQRQSMPAWDVSWTSLGTWKLPPGLHVAANWRSRPGIAGRLADARGLAEALARGRPATA
jgi:oxygen-dependent protoporphyrinogen oxidase